MMRKPILAGAVGAVGAIAVIAGLLTFGLWPFGDSSSPQDSPTPREEGAVSPAPEDILDVDLSVGDSVISEVTRDGEKVDNHEALGTGENPTATGERPRSGLEEGSTVQGQVDFEVRDANGNIKQSGSSR